MRKRSTHIGIAGVCVIFLYLCLPAYTVAQPEGVTLHGFIRDAESAESLNGANVVVTNLADTTETRGTVAGSNGYYYFNNLESGSYAIHVSYVGYNSSDDTLSITGGKDKVTHTVELTPSERELDEVVVTGTKGGATTLEAGRQRITSQDLSRISTPSVSGDLADYLQTLPSVVSMGDRGGQLFIRGGAPDQNMVFMDRILVYRPFHISGFYSAFPQEIISSADVYAGGFPAKYSGRISSVIDVRMRGGDQKKIAGSGTLGPFLSGITVEGPVNNNGLSFIASGRFSQIERTSPVLLGQEQPLRFEDQFIKLQHVGDQSRCGVTGLHTYDRGKIDANRGDVFRWTNYGFGGRCVSLTTGSSSIMDVSVSTSYTENSVGDSDDPERVSKIWNVSTNVELEGPLKGGHQLSGGFQGRVEKAFYSLDEKFNAAENGEHFVTNFTGYFTLDLDLHENLDIEPGLSAGGSPDYGFRFEPRFRFAWRPFGSEDEELNASFGIFQQNLVALSDERDLGSAFKAWMAPPADQGRPRAVHAILGWRQEIGNFSLTAEGYHKEIQNLAVPIWSNFARFTTEVTPAEGTVWGFDLRGEFKKGPIYAYLGYGFSWTEYTTSQELFGIGNQSYHPPHDQRHSLNAIVSSDLGFAKLDVRWQFGSGTPYTRPFGFDSMIPLRDLQDPREEYGMSRLLFDEPYEARLPVSHRLDVSMKRKFEFKLANLTAKAGVINAYNRRNLFYYDLFSFRRIDQLPIIPFAAIEIATN